MLSIVYQKIGLYDIYGYYLYGIFASLQCTLQENDTKNLFEKRYQFTGKHFGDGL